jgi:hypothetical protein
MSDESWGMQDPPDDPDGPDEFGETGEATQSEEPQQREYLDIDDDLGGRYVRVKVDGEDVETTLSDALGGYSRTADYTRKTQELAAQRQEAQYALTLQRALEANPRETLQLLASRYGVDYAQQVAEQYQQPDEFEDDPYADPLEQRLNQMESRFQSVQEQLAQRQADEQLRYAVGGLQQRYQIDDNTVREVVSRALQMGVGPESFDTVYKGMAFDKLMARAAAEREQTEKRQAEDAKRTAGKQSAARVVSQGGMGPSTQATPPGAAESKMSLREAFEAAWEQEVEGRSR